MRYDELALGAARLSFVVEVALLAEVGMVQPAELCEGRAPAVPAERLTRCTITISTRAQRVGALTELVRR